MSGFSPERVAREIVEAIIKPSSNAEELNSLRQTARSMSIGDWKARQIAFVTGPGALAGGMGGPWGIAAMGADLLWLGKNAGHGCLGVGYAAGKSNVVLDDIDLILAVWAGILTPSNTAPSDRVAVAISENVSPYGSITRDMGYKIEAKVAAKSLPKLIGKVISKKVAIKGGSKLGAQIASLAISKASVKLASKLAAKLGTSWIPIFGGVVSGGINWWLMAGLLDAAEKYYTHSYVLLDDMHVSDLREVAVLA